MCALFQLIMLHLLTEANNAEHLDNSEEFERQSTRAAKRRLINTQAADSDILATNDQWILDLSYTVAFESPLTVRSCALTPSLVFVPSQMLYDNPEETLPYAS